MSTFTDLEDQVNTMADQMTADEQVFNDLVQSLGDVPNRPGQLDFPLDDQSIQLIKEQFVTGTVTLVGGTATVFSGAIASSSMIFLTRNTLGGTPGHLSLASQQAGSFVINSSSATDTSTINYLII